MGMKQMSEDVKWRVTLMSAGVKWGMTSMSEDVQWGMTRMSEDVHRRGCGELNGEDVGNDGNE